MDSVKFTCKCKKMENWITEGQETDACPECGRRYVGEYNKRKLTIVAKEIK